MQGRHARQELVELGRKIRALREARGFTQEQFAEEAGLDRAYYGGVERGERNVAALNLIRIARALGVEVGELFPPVSVHLAGNQATLSHKRVSDDVRKDRAGEDGDE